MEQHQSRFAQRLRRSIECRSNYGFAVAYAATPVWCAHLFLKICITQPLIWFACALATFGQATADLSQHAKKAQEAIAANNITEAKRELQAILALDPKNVGAYANLGMVEFIRADYQDAAKKLPASAQARPVVSKRQGIPWNVRIAPGRMMPQADSSSKSRSMAWRTGICTYRPGSNW